MSWSARPSPGRVSGSRSPRKHAPRRAAEQTQWNDVCHSGPGPGMWQLRLFLDDRIFQKGTLALISQSSERQGSVPDSVHPTTGCDSRAPSALLQGRTGVGGEGGGAFCYPETSAPPHTLLLQNSSRPEPQTRRACQGFQHGGGRVLCCSPAPTQLRGPFLSQGVS